jgi:hypothetical protein
MKEEQLEGVSYYSEEIWISPPSAILACSIGGIDVEAHLNPNMEVNVMLGT